MRYLSSLVLTGLVVFLLVGFSDSSYAKESNRIPHTVAGNLYNNDGSIPGEGDIRFTAYIEGRVDDVLTEESTGCGYNASFWQVNAGNFKSGWNAGNVLVVEFENKKTGQKTSAQVTLSTNDPDDAGKVTF